MRKVAGRYSLAVWVKTSTTSSPVTRANRVQASNKREWSSSQLRISTSVPSASAQRVGTPPACGGKSDCQHSLGWAASNRRRAVSYTHLRAHETVLDLVCRLLLEKK